MTENDKPTHFKHKIHLKKQY